MQFTKGGCVGQTFALAKLNDSSGGKKSKRRSKDERKGMVESFVKRYQASNNGSFPSLYLTHKEVGGSYYTVREIFRELIQENRVLGPPKLLPGEQNMENLDSFLENYPLGSISFDPNVHGLQPKDNQTLLNEYELRHEKILNSRRISVLHRQSLDKDHNINGNIHSLIEHDECKDPGYRDLLKGGGGIIDSETSQISETIVEETVHAAVISKVSEENMHMESVMERGNKVKEAYQPQILPLSEGVVVETFPLRPVSSTIDSVDETTEKEVLNAKLEEEVASLPPMPKQGAILETQTHLFANENVDIKSENMPPAEIKASSGLNDTGSLRQSTFEETTVNKNKLEAQKQTLGAYQINVESLEASAAASEKSDSQETNPIVSFIKTFVAAFMKIWSE